MKKLLFFMFTVFCFKVFSLSDYNSILQKGLDDYNKAQYNFAITNLNRYIQQSGDNNLKPKAYFYLGLSYYFTGNYKSSLNRLNELTSKYRFSDYTGQSYFWKGLICQNLNQWDDAERFFLKFIQTMPKSDVVDKAYLALANSHYEQAEYADAEKNLKILIDNYKESSKYEEASVLYAYLLLKFEKNDQAESFLDIWIGKLADRGENYLLKDRFWLYRGEIAFKKKDYPVARVLYKKIDLYAKESPSSDIALLRLSQIEKESGNDSDSARYLVRLSNEYPDSQYNLDASYYMAINFYNKGDFAGSYDLLNQTKIIIDKKFKEKTAYSREDLSRLKNVQANCILYIAEINFRNKEFQKAAANLYELIDNDSEHKSTALIRLLEYYTGINDQAKFDELSKKYNDFLLSDGKIKNQYLFIKAQAEYNSREYAKSMQTLEKIESAKEYGNLVLSLKSKNLIRQNKINEAIAILEESLQNSPLDRKPYIVLELINLYFNIQDYSKVITNSSLVKTYSMNLKETEKTELMIKSDFHTALSYMMIKNYNKGIETMESILSKYKTASLNKDLTDIISKSYYYLGWMNYKRTEYARAAFYFEIAKTSDIDEKFTSDSYFMEAWSYFTQKNFSKAKETFTNVYKKFYPKDQGIKAYYYLGKTCFNLGDRSGATSIFNEIYFKFSDNGYKENALYEIIQGHLENNRTAEANKLIEEFAGKYPKSALYKDLLVRQADTLLANQKYSEALSVYLFIINKNLITENPDTVYYWAALSSFKINDYETSKKYLEEIINSFRSSSFFNNSLELLIRIYQEEKNYKKLETVLTDVIKSEKDKNKLSEYSDILKSISLIKQGFDEKESLLMTKIETGNIEAKYELAVYYYENGKTDNAQKLLNEIIKENSELTGSKALMLSGDIQVSKENYNEALLLYISVIEKNKNSRNIYPECLYKISYCYYKLEDKDNFIKTAAKLKRTYPDSQWTEKVNEIEKRIKK